jgi:hypothetical protein
MASKMPLSSSSTLTSEAVLASRMRSVHHLQHGGDQGGHNGLTGSLAPTEAREICREAV